MGSMMDEQEKDRLKAQKIAREQSHKIMEEMDICDKENKEYPIYRYKLEFQLYTAIKSALNL
jgi:hypothetical protein